MPLDNLPNSISKSTVVKHYEGPFESGKVIDEKPASYYLENGKLYLVVLSSSTVTGSAILTPTYATSAWRASVTHAVSTLVALVAFDGNGLYIRGSTTGLASMDIYELKIS